MAKSEIEKRIQELENKYCTDEGLYLMMRSFSQEILRIEDSQQQKAFLKIYEEFYRINYEKDDKINTISTQLSFVESDNYDLRDYISRLLSTTKKNLKIQKKSLDDRIIPEKKFLKPPVETYEQEDTMPVFAMTEYGMTGEEFITYLLAEDSFVKHGRFHLKNVDIYRRPLLYGRNRHAFAEEVSFYVNKENSLYYAYTIDGPWAIPVGNKQSFFCQSLDSFQYKNLTEIKDLQKLDLVILGMVDSDGFKEYAKTQVDELRGKIAPIGYHEELI